MSASFNIYCDESCHLEHDHQRVMVLGAVTCPLDAAPAVAARIREIKLEYRLPAHFEAKWTKVSPSKLPMYRRLIEYFFDEPALHFRALVVPDKTLLRHDRFRQTHDDWYFKMYFDLLKVLVRPPDRYRVYLDIKDSRSALKVAKLHEVLRAALGDRDGRIVERIQSVRSHEVYILQLADLLIGAISYASRGLSSSPAKSDLVRLIRTRSGRVLTASTAPGTPKVDIFRWQATTER